MNYETYRIPANFTDAGKLFGMFPIRNSVEAVIAVLPIAACLLMLPPFGLTTRMIITLIVAVPVGGFALLGINDDSLTAFLRTWFQWKLGRAVITYRGRPPHTRKKKKGENGNGLEAITIRETAGAGAHGTVWKIHAKLAPGGKRRERRRHHKGRKVFENTGDHAG